MVQVLADLAVILIVVAPVSLWVGRQVTHGIAARRAEQEKAELAIADLASQVEDLARKLDDLTRRVDQLVRRSQSSGDYSTAVSSGLGEALEGIDQLNDRVSKLTDISFRELTRLGERVSDLSQLAHQHVAVPENGESAKD